MNSHIVNEVLQKFNIHSEINIYGNGHINDTYACESSKYILQRINTAIFKDPEALMENIENVTSFLRDKIKAYGGDPERETLTIIKTSDGKNCCKYDDNHVFRLYNFIPDTKTVEDDKTLEDIYNAGIGFGRFQRLLDDFPVEKLHETIADFHNTPKRVEVLRNAIKADKAGRAASVLDEIEFALSDIDFTTRVTDGIKNGDIPLRVTHNDTKINNILFDKASGKAVCVIDLDTVMAGSMLYDFGDALRMGGSTAAEDETDLDKVHFDIASFESFTKGYLRETRSILTDAEAELLPMSIRLMTYECGIRFLTDHLEGDTYFKIHRENHNLDRARNQFKLCRELKEKEPQLREIVKSLI